MDERIPGKLVVIFLFVFPTVLFLILGMVLGHSFGVCFLSGFIGVALLYLIYWIKDSSLYHKSDKKDFEEYYEEEGPEKKKYSTDKAKSEEQKYSVERSKSKKEQSWLSSVFSGEETCDTCGTEMEYKEGYDGYYCPECHEYK